MPRTFTTQLIDGAPVYITHTKERRGRTEFVQAFSEAWKLLPKEVTDTILGYWKEGETSLDRYWPMIQLVPVIEEGRDVVGRCMNEGYELYFVGPEVKKLPKRATYGLILHELAHVYCYATDDPCNSGFDEDAYEIAVRKLLKKWNLYEFQDELDQERPGTGAWLLSDNRRKSRA
jgi:hypothetical protein